MTVTIKYGDEKFYCEGDYDDVCKAIVDGKPLDVWTAPYREAPSRQRNHRRITFFGDPDYVELEL